MKALPGLSVSICQQYTYRESLDQLGDALCTLGSIAAETNDIKATLRHNEGFLATCLRMAKDAGAEDERLGVAYNQMSVAWTANKDYGKAMTSLHNAITVYKNLTNYTPLMTTFPLVNLGLAYWLQGDLDKASEVLERGLNDRETILGAMDKTSFR